MKRLLRKWAGRRKRFRWSTSKTSPRAARAMKQEAAQQRRSRRESPDFQSEEHVNRGRRALTIALLLVAVTACSDTTVNGAEHPVERPRRPHPSRPSNPPPRRPRSRPSRNRRSELANAPIGGNAAIGPTAPYQCAEVKWLGRNPIPAGTAIRTGAAHLESGGIFEFQQDGCRPDDAPCSNVDWQKENFSPCYVGVRQAKSATSDEPVTLILEAVAVCETQADCDSLVGDQKGSQITFVPDQLLSPSEAPSESNSESPSESPTHHRTVTTRRRLADDDFDSPTDSPSGSAGG